MGICWDFPLLGSSSKRGTNDAAITMFKLSGDMDGLAREVCQNSLDARRHDLPSDKAVTVKFSLVNVRRDDFDMFAGYADALAGARAYWKDNPLGNEDISTFLDNVENALSGEEIPVLVMSDYGTTGLNGVDAAPNEVSYWDLLLNTEGISIKQDNNSAGSFGIGKNAPFAYSSLNMVFYNTYATDGGRAFQGVTHLVTTQRKVAGRPRPTSDTGKYLFLEDEYTWRPILPSDGSALANIDAFKRDEYGTDVAIFGFKKHLYENWEKQIAVALLKNFVMAIMDGKLEAVVESDEQAYTISADTLEKLLFTVFKDESHLKYTRQIYETIKEGSASEAKIAEDGDLTIYMRYEDRYSQSLSRFRSTGMLINTTTSDCLPHFSVVVVVNDVGERLLSETLRAAEPPQHTEWRGKWITDNQTLRNRANRYIRGIRSAVQSVLDEFERADIAESMDAGIGDYIPDATDQTGLGAGSDGLKMDLKIKTIRSKDGSSLYNNQLQSAATSSGTDVDSPAVKAGKKKRKKKSKKKINVVKPSKGDSPGVSPSKGKVRVAVPNIVDHRTFLVGGTKYKLYIESEQPYDNVFIQYSAGREDDSEDSLQIKDYKAEGQPLATGGFDRIGPISLRAGSNDIYIDFADEEVLAVVPVFTMEVHDGE